MGRKLCIDVKYKGVDYDHFGESLLACIPNSLENSFLYRRSWRVKKHISDFLTPELKQ